MVKIAHPHTLTNKVYCGNYSYSYWFEILLQKWVSTEKAKGDSLNVVYFDPHLF